MQLNGKELARRVVSGLGGVTETARFFEIKPPSVSDWLKSGLPAARLRHVRDIRPDLLVDEPDVTPIAASAHPALEGAHSGGGETKPLFSEGCDS